MRDDKIKVLYIAGAGRSGSTLLERMLGQIDDVVAVGELRHIWDRSFAENQLCGCGVPFADCRFWRSAIREAFGEYDSARTGEIKSLKHAVDRVRYIPLMLSPWKPPSYAKSLQTYKETMLQLYRAIARVSGKKVIIESSKDPSTAFLLGSIPQISPYITHLVRDSRGVAFSWRRKRLRLEIAQGKIYMPTYSPARSAWDWSYRNVVVSLTKRLGLPYTLVRYEDLIANPLQTTAGVLKALNVETQHLDFIAEDAVSLDVTNHTVSGNPLRFQNGRIDLRLDLEWTSKMEMSERWLVTFLTLPLLWHYGYGLAGRQ
jgi:hypothetical protein